MFTLRKRQEWIVIRPTEETKAEYSTILAPVGIGYIANEPESDHEVEGKLEMVPPFRASSGGLAALYGASMGQGF